MLAPRSPRCTGFNPRLRAGGDIEAYALKTGLMKFQPTPPRGRRPPWRQPVR